MASIDEVLPISINDHMSEVNSISNWLSVFGIKGKISHP